MLVRDFSVFVSVFCSVVSLFLFLFFCVPSFFLLRNATVLTCACFVRKGGGGMSASKFAHCHHCRRPR